MAPFKLAINMAGAISAGAYTAGVLDFLTEALDAWYLARAAGERVPMHDVRIEAFTGASAGGMCAAISAVQLQTDFEHISDVARTGTRNALYESWVNRIDMVPLLDTGDLPGSGQVVSILNSTIVDTIAAYALSPMTIQPCRPYVSPDLNVVVSLTNLRGVPYSLTGVAPGSVEETTFFHGDRMRFQTVRGHADTVPNGVCPLDLTCPEGWTQLRQSAMATGAFPIFLAPRVLMRRQEEYVLPLWQGPAATGGSTLPTFPPGMPNPFPTVNVDGGVTNNDPYNFAHDFLASLAPQVPVEQDAARPVLDTDACTVDRAVLSISPFPTTEAYCADYDQARASGLLRSIPSLFSTLIAQSRFYGQSLAGMMNGTTFAHFVIAPSDQEQAESAATGVGAVGAPPALQCASLGGFGGFFERGFRAHDYALGRRNCQKFLMSHFILPATNPVMKQALDAMAAPDRARLLETCRDLWPTDPAGKRLQFPADSCVTADTVWLPLIPLCTPALSTPIPPVPRAAIRGARVDQIVSLMLTRFRALWAVMLTLIPHAGLRLFLMPGSFFIARLSRKLVKAKLAKEFGDAYVP